jgi:hypothetical protein
LHSEGATEPRHPIGSDVAPLDLKKSNNSKFVKLPAFAFSLPKQEKYFITSESINIVGFPLWKECNASMNKK